MDSKSKSASQSQDRTSPYPKLPAALDSHNYAKSPLMEGLASGRTDCQLHYEDYSGSDYSDDESRSLEKDISNDTSKNTCGEGKLPEATESSMKPLSINTSPDILKPLSIQTKFETSPAPSASSTDTSSEVGSAFNSPVQSSHSSYSQSSPNSTKSCKPSDLSIFDDVRDIKKFVVIRMSSSCPSDVNPDSSSKSDCKSDTSKKGSDVSEEPSLKRIRIDSEGSGTSFDNASGIEKQDTDKKHSDKKNSDLHDSDCGISPHYSAKHPQLIEPHRFAPKVVLI